MSVNDQLNGDLKGGTGAGKRDGIGYAIVDKLALCGANVVITGQSGAGMEPMHSLAAKLAEKHGVKTHPWASVSTRFAPAYRYRPAPGCVRQDSHGASWAARRSSNVTVALASEPFSFVTGPAISIDGGPTMER